MHVWPRNFPKIHTCAVRHTGGNEGLSRVGMSLDGCRGVHWHAASAKQGKKSDWWVNMTYLGKHVCVGNDRKDNVVTTCPKKWEKETNRQNRKHSGKPTVQTL